MTEADIFPLLSSLAGGQVFPYVVPLNATGEPEVTAPWLVFSLVSQVAADVLCGPAETSTSVQVDVYASTIDEARDIRSKAMTALAPLGTTQQMRTQGYESDPRLYRATVEVVITD